jgi:hypothetical protein
MFEIIKQRQEDGSSTYRQITRGGNIEIETYTETFYELVSKEISTLEDLFNILKGGDYDRLIYIAEVLVNNIRRLMDEADDFILKEFGEVQVERALWGQDIIDVKGGQMLGVTFRPVKDK